MTTKDEALNATMADSALERMAENERELGLDYMEPAPEPTTKQKVDAAVEQYAKTGNGRVLEVALRNIIINETLDKMAKNARELGLDYKPAQKDYKEFYDGKKWCSVEVEQPAQGQEPVAMRHSFDGYGWKYTDMGFGSGWKEWTLKQHPDAEPVYTTPPGGRQSEDCLAAATVQEPLTDEQIKQAKPVCADFVSFRAGVRYAEARYKEKQP